MTREQIIATFTIFLGLTTATAVSDAIWADTLFCTVVDPKTGMTCGEINENPNHDVYYIVDDSDYNDEIWASAQQRPETVRWNLDGDKFIVKYNVKDVPRDQVGLAKALQNPMTNDEILEVLNSSDWKIDDENIVKEDDRKHIFVEDIINN